MLFRESDDSDGPSSFKVRAAVGLAIADVELALSLLVRRAEEAAAGAKYEGDERLRVWTAVTAVQGPVNTRKRCGGCNAVTTLLALPSALANGLAQCPNCGAQFNS